MMTIGQPGQTEARRPTRIHLPEMGSLYLRGRIWWLEYWHQGKPHRESSHSQGATRAGLQKCMAEGGEGNRSIGPSVP